MFDQVAGPLVERLGFRTAALDSSGPHYRALLESGGLVVSVLIVTPWGQDLSVLWRDMVRHGLAWAARWCLCVSGPVLRVTDSQRTYARRFAEIDLQSAAEHDATFAVLWGLLRAAALAGPAPSVLDRAVAMSDQHRVSVRNSLQQGVEEALTRLTRAFLRAQHRRLRRAARPASAALCADESLMIIYRILFLLFAEARGLVPKWHPVFRDSYTIEALRADVERCRGRPGSGKRCRRSPGSRIAAAAPARFACRRSTAGCSRRRTPRSRTSWRWTMARCGRRCWR